MFKHLREIDRQTYAFCAVVTWWWALALGFCLALWIPSSLLTRAKDLEDNNVLKFMAENGYQQKWEPNSQSLIWTKDVK